jgi:hypothetical protein
MTEVKASPLKVGDTFSKKDRMLLRIVEEANLYGVCMAIKRSDTFQVNTHGLNGDAFHVYGNFGKSAGWKVTACVVGIKSISRPATPNATAAEKRTSPAGNNNSVDPLALVEIGGQEGNLDDIDGDDTDDDGNGNEMKTTSERQKSPVKSKYLLPLMKAAITERPNISSKEQPFSSCTSMISSSPMHFCRKLAVTSTP